MSKRKSSKKKRIHIQYPSRREINAMHGRLPTLNPQPLPKVEWAALKKRVYATYGRVCMRCGYAPKNKRHINVDHIKTRLYFPELALEFDNMQVLCGTCNRKKGNGCATDYRLAACDASDEWSDHNLSQFLRTLQH
jgi:5-methylcytosine-specific restriction endonuclease McrA